MYRKLFLVLALGAMGIASAQTPPLYTVVDGYKVDANTM